MKFDYDPETGLDYCATVGEYFLSGEQTEEQKLKAKIKFEHEREMAELEEDSDFLESPEIWNGYNYGTEDNPIYKTAEGKWFYFISFLATHIYKFHFINFRCSH